MDAYAALAEQLLSQLDAHRHMPPEQLSATMRGEMAVLKLLSAEKRALSAGCISRELHMTTSRIAAVLNSLEKKDMIKRVCDPADKRRVFVHLTDGGKTCCAQRRKAALQHMTGLLTQLGEEDARTFVRLIGRLIEIGPKAPDFAEDELRKETRRIP